ncbi:hypothetical protein [Azospirillum sp. B2RO_4]|uniref:hypothetical protein n=1 Tax=Azospirillum sp. B2RO_4 TaxID=3027796 RepID=UPI003DA7F5A9
MKSFKILSLNSLACAAGLAVGIAIAALPASAQTTGNSATGTNSSDSTDPQNKLTGNTGQLPPNSLPGERKGAIGGAPVSQGSSGSSTEGATSPTGRLPNDSLQNERQGVIGGHPVTQGGSGQSDDKKDEQ